MHFKTSHFESASRPFPFPFRPRQQKPDGTLSRRDLQRIVAEMLG